MKKLIFALMMTFLVVVPSHVWAGKGETDSVLTAEYFSKYEIDEVQGTVYFYVLSEGTQQYRYLDYVYIPGTGFVSMEDDNGAVIVTPDDKPLQYFPFPDEDVVHQVSIYARGYSKGQARFSGSGHLDYPKDNDVVVIEMRPDKIEGFVSYDLPGGVDISSVRIEFNNQTFHYNHDLEGFQIWYDPIQVDQEYQIWSGGVLLSTGIFDVEKRLAIPDETQGGGMHFSVPDGVEMVDMTIKQTYYFGSVNLNGSTRVVNGEDQPAKVFVVAPNEEMYGFFVVVDNIQDFEITCYGLKNGQRELISGPDRYSPYKSGRQSIYIFHEEDFDEIMVVLTKVESASGNSFSVTLVESYGKG